MQILKAVLTLALLLRRNDLEVAVLKRGRLLRLRRRPALLRDLRPAASRRLVLGWGGRVALVEDALVCQLTAAQELFGKMAGIERVGGRVHRLGDELSVRGEAQKRGDEVFGCDILVMYCVVRVSERTIDALVKVVTELFDGPLAELLLSINLARLATERSAAAHGRLLYRRRDNVSARGTHRSSWCRASGRNLSLAA